MYRNQQNWVITYFSYANFIQSLMQPRKCQPKVVWWMNFNVEDQKREAGWGQTKIHYYPKTRAVSYQQQNSPLNPIKKQYIWLLGCALVLSWDKLRPGQKKYLRWLLNLDVHSRSSSVLCSGDTLISEWRSVNKWCFIQIHDIKKVINRGNILISVSNLKHFRLETLTSNQCLWLEISDTDQREKWGLRKYNFSDK